MQAPPVEFKHTGRISLRNLVIFIEWSLRQLSELKIYLNRQAVPAFRLALSNTAQRQQIGLVAGGLGLAVAAIAIASSTSGPGPFTTQIAVLEQIALPPPSSVMRQVGSVVRVERVQRGDTIQAVMNRLGVFDQAFLRFIRSDARARPALELKPGRFVVAHIDPDNRIEKYEVVIDRGAATATRMQVKRAGSSQAGYSIIENTVNIEKQIETRYAEVRGSFFAATDAAGIPDAIATQIADIFGTEIDFNRDLRNNDTLRVVYEMLKVPDSLEQAVPGRVLAVQLNHRGRHYDAQWFERGTDGVGQYFSGNGVSRKKSFLRSPLEVSRITSGFTEARLNPVSKAWSAHKGVDMAAPIGTNIRAAGDGVVEFVGVQRGYGNVVVIRHGKRYETLYAHMHEFAEGLQVGRKVRQGDIIGTVGMTGFATGPHLHYEFKVDGEHVDPMTATMPTAEPLTASEQRRFFQLSGAYKAKMQSIQLARAAGYE